MPHKQRLFFRNVFLILLGNFIYAVAVTAFILPNGLITGGSTGLALLFYHQFGLPITLFVSLFNLLMFVLGALVLGKTFALTTLLSSLFYPLALIFCQSMPFFKDMTSDPLLAAIYAGLLIGFSIGIVIKAGASTGGMDIPPLVINKKSGLPVALVMYAFDFSILLAQIFFANKEQVLYGILLVLIYTLVLDKVLLFGQAQTQVKIVSDKYEEINQLITRRLDRGSTLIQAQTGYQRRESMLVLTVVSNRELPRLNELVLSIDPHAFMIINSVNEVKGRGFSADKSYLEG
ncbi:MAG: YitT family protein [Anaerolineae bacterium]|nr:YitT family protein [Anaerolineae bacterium]